MRRGSLGAIGIGLACAVVAACSAPQALAQQSLGQTLPSPPAGFDASGSSPGVIPFQPDALLGFANHYVSGNAGITTGPLVGTDINAHVGANTFYNNGYTGSNVAVASIEAGHIWSGHETLTTTLQIDNHASSINEVDRHATWVGMILAGRRAGRNPGAYQEGMVPDAQLYSGAIASQWSNRPRYAGSFRTFNSSMFDQYRKAYNGMDASGRVADVINSSYGGGDATGTGTRSTAIDGFASATPTTTFVASAGNDGPGPNSVDSPATSYNGITVGALAPNPGYNFPATFTSGGPNNYRDPLNGTISNARQVVDIAAPGVQQSSAYYGGETGGNGTTDNPSVSGPGPHGPPSAIPGSLRHYSRGIQGTSFASPTVAGGAALLKDAAYVEFSGNPHARDTRVVKSVLMNSADKTVNWNNGQVPHPNGNGGVFTTQGLDNLVGTGAMNLDAGYSQFLEGTTDVPGLAGGDLGVVDPLGWDFGQVASGTPNDYFIGAPLLGGTTFTATLSWFRDRSVDASNNVFDESYDNLDLELWSVTDGNPDELISESASLYNNSEHFTLTLPRTGDYALRVVWFDELFDLVGDADQELYGLAWSAVAVPEPAGVVLMGLAGVAVFVVAGRRRVRWRG